MRKYCAAAGLLVLVVVNVAPAWWVKGHGTIAQAAALGLPDEVPAFFRAADKQFDHLAGEPDRWKNPSLKVLRAAESPDHYIDLEDYEGNTLPPDRYQAIALLVKLKHAPERAGLLPYAIVENYERLCGAFYDYRADPENLAIRAKCIVYAGVLSHYTGDSAMPLHTTRDYDGRKGPDNKTVQRGIHAKIDAFPEKNGFTAKEVSRGLKAAAVDDVWARVVKNIQDSYSQINRCYELDAAAAFERPTEESRKFIMERCRVAAQLTMDLWYSAWLRSAKMPAHY